MPNGTFPYNAFTAAERELIAKALRQYADDIVAADPSTAADHEASVLALSLAESFEEVQA